MELKKLTSQLIKVSNNIEDIEKALIYVFAKKLNCDYSTSQFFKDYFNDINTNFVDSIDNFVVQNNVTSTIYTLVEIFEMLIPANECKENGMVLTPASIKNYILDAIITSGDAPVVCDPACGVGNIAEVIKEYYPNNRLYCSDLIE